MYQKIVILFLFSIFILISCSGLDLPYVGFHAFNFNIYSLIAHNYLEFGLLATKFSPIISVTEQLPINPNYYLHHPPLISLVLAGAFALFGEHFWVGRLTVIVFSMGSMILLYILGKILKGNKFGVLVLMTGCLMPASALFGRMIGQEALVLFFCLLTLVLLIFYLKNSKNLYLIGVLASIMLGTLSDWPMVYFVGALFPYFMIKRRLRLYWLLMATSVSVAAGYLLYIFLIQGGYADLISAFFVRSVEAHSGDYWWLRWTSLLLIRIAVYFNPLFVLIAVFGLYQIILRRKKQLYTFEHPLLFSLALFGLTHILLYPAGSFGHPYWIYYLLPFFALLVARTLISFPKLVLIVVFTLSLLFLLKAERWKTGETKANIWRYELARLVSHTVPRYENIAVNHDSAMDFDVLRYAFLIDFKQLRPQEVPSDNRYYVYSCINRCEVSSADLHFLLQKFDYHHSQLPEGEVYIFDFQHQGKYQDQEIIASEKVSEVYPAEPQSIYRRAYTFFINWLDAPQI